MGSSAGVQSERGIGAHFGLGGVEVRLHFRPMGGIEGQVDGARHAMEGLGSRSRWSPRAGGTNRACSPACSRNRQRPRTPPKPPKTACLTPSTAFKGTVSIPPHPQL